MKKAIVLLLGPMCAVFLLSLLVTPQTRISHQDSSAFQIALQSAVDRLEGSGKMLLAGTATPVHAQPGGATFDGRYTCETYEQGLMTCDPAYCGEHTTEHPGYNHTCLAEEYTCQRATCDTYDPRAMTCDPNVSECNLPHTTEPAPYAHTCQGHTCDGSFTCDFTADPRALTCDAADGQCTHLTFDAFQPTCDPLNPDCRLNNPGHCTAEGYHTCDPMVQTCEPGMPGCSTIDPTEPGCATPVKRTTWGHIKARYGEQ